MQEGANRFTRKDSVGTVWDVYDERYDSHYVPRCSVCGGYKEGLFVHWFFTGLYCRACIQYKLYGDFRTIENINEGVRNG